MNTNLIVQQNGLALQYVENQTPEICLAAVRKNGRALQHVKNQTPEICLAAVRQNPKIEQKIDRHTAALIDKARIEAHIEKIVAIPSGVLQQTTRRRSIDI